MVVPHREKFCDVRIKTAAVPFKQVLRVSPRNPNMFPWLRSIAACFDMFNFRSLTLEYVPSCPTTTVGKILLAFDYDAADDNYAVNFDHLIETAGAVTDNIWAPVNCKYVPARTVLPAHRYFCSDGQTGDRLEIPCQAIVAATSDTTTIVGSVYVSYVVELTNPEPAPNVQPQTLTLRSRDVTSTATKPLNAAADVAGTVAAAVQSGSPDDLMRVVNTIQDELMPNLTNLGGVFDKSSHTLVSMVTEDGLTNYNAWGGLGDTMTLLGTGVWDLTTVDANYVAVNMPGIKDFFVLFSFYGNYAGTGSGDYPNVNVVLSQNMRIKYTGSSNKRPANCTDFSILDQTTVYRYLMVEAVSEPYGKFIMVPQIVTASGGAVTWTGTLNDAFAVISPSYAGDLLDFTTPIYRLH
jgi:hypothetical protein